MHLVKFVRKFGQETDLSNSFSSSHFGLHLGKVVVVGGDICHDGLIIRS